MEEQNQPKPIAATQSPEYEKLAARYNFLCEEYRKVKTAYLDTHAKLSAMTAEYEELKEARSGREIGQERRDLADELLFAKKQKEALEAENKSLKDSLKQLTELLDAKVVSGGEAGSGTGGATHKSAPSPEDARFRERFGLQDEKEYPVFVSECTRDRKESGVLYITQARVCFDDGSKQPPRARMGKGAAMDVVRFGDILRLDTGEMTMPNEFRLEVAGGRSAMRFVVFGGFSDRDGCVSEIRIQAQKFGKVL